MCHQKSILTDFIEPFTHIIAAIFFHLKKNGKRIDFFITGQPTWQRLSCHMAHFYINFVLMCIACLSEANVKMTIVSHFWASARRTLAHSSTVISKHLKSFTYSTINIKENQNFFLSFLKLLVFWFMNLDYHLKLSTGGESHMYCFPLSSVSSQERFTTCIKPLSANGFLSWAAILSIYYLLHNLIPIHMYIYTKFCNDLAIFTSFRGLLMQLI